jgi:hypothetical protein
MKNAIPYDRYKNRAEGMMFLPSKGGGAASFWFETGFHAIEGLPWPAELPARIDVVQSPLSGWPVVDP